MGKHWHFPIRFVLLAMILLTPAGAASAQHTEQENPDSERSVKEPLGFDYTRQASKTGIELMDKTLILKGDRAELIFVIDNEA